LISAWYFAVALRSLWHPTPRARCSDAVVLPASLSQHCAAQLLVLPLTALGLLCVFRNAFPFAVLKLTGKAAVAMLRGGLLELRDLSSPSACEFNCFSFNQFPLSKLLDQGSFVAFG
jgi:hypothetical protein